MPFLSFSMARGLNVIRPTKQCKNLQCRSSMSLSNSNLLLDNRHGVTCTAILPIELWSYVFQFTSKADLLTLCVVSRSFHQEAERALYRDINLSDTKLYAWAEKVAQRLDLAACVQTLALSISQFPQVQIIGLKSVHEALQVLPNLKDLTLRSAPTGLCFSPSYAWLLSGCSFRLKAFRNSMFDLSPIISFLASQPDICLWEQQSATPFDFTDEILPNLTSVSVPLWLVDKLKLPRPIQEMSFSMGLMEKMEEVKFISSLGRYKDTTTKLRMERWVSEDSMLLEHFISCLAEYVPYIEYFSIFSIGVSVGLSFSISNYIL